MSSQNIEQWSNDSNGTKEQSDCLSLTLLMVPAERPYAPARETVENADGTLTRTFPDGRVCTRESADNRRILRATTSAGDELSFTYPDAESTTPNSIKVGGIKFIVGESGCLAISLDQTSGLVGIAGLDGNNAPWNISMEMSGKSEVSNSEGTTSTSSTRRNKQRTETSVTRDNQQNIVLSSRREENLSTGVWEQTDINHAPNGTMTLSQSFFDLGGRVIPVPANRGQVDALVRNARATGQAILGADGRPTPDGKPVMIDNQPLWYERVREQRSIFDPGTGMHVQSMTTTDGQFFQIKYIPGVFQKITTPLDIFGRK